MSVSKRWAKKTKSVKENKSDVNFSATLSTAMPSATEVAAERAKETAYERELATLLREEGGACGENSDSCGSDGESRLLNALGPLRTRARSERPPAAAVLLLALADALRAAHDTGFLDEYRQRIEEDTDAKLQGFTEQLMQSIEEGLSADAAAAAAGGGVVLACWLCAAVVWRGPRAPGAVLALRCLLHHLAPHQVSEVAGALHGAGGSLRPRDLIALSDAVRGATLAPLLLRAALCKLLALEPRWHHGALGAGELRTALAERWVELDAAARLAAVALAGRVLAGETARGEATALLAALTPLRDAQSHDPDHLKARVAVKTLHNLFKSK